MDHPNRTSHWSRILAQSHGLHQELIHQDQGDGDRQQHDSAMDIPRLAMFMDVYGCSWMFIMVYHSLSIFFSGNDPTLRDGSLIPFPDTVSLGGMHEVASGEAENVRGIQVGHEEETKHRRFNQHCPHKNVDGVFTKKNPGIQTGLGNILDTGHDWYVATPGVSSNPRKSSSHKWKPRVMHDTCGQIVKQVDRQTDK